LFTAIDDLAAWVCEGVVPAGDDASFGNLQRGATRKLDAPPPCR
jgi:hypothetical protein